jgi:hypothetical protein
LTHLELSFVVKAASSKGAFLVAPRILGPVSGHDFTVCGKPEALKGHGFTDRCKIVMGRAMYRGMTSVVPETQQNEAGL